MSRHRIAFFTPVNPVRCGVSDYSEDLLPHLAELADVDVVIEPYRPSHPDLARNIRFLTMDEFRANPAGYTSYIYQVANSFQYHGYVLPFLTEFPGIVVLHDFSLQYLMLGCSVQQGDLGLLERFLEPVYGDRSASLARKLFFSRINPYEVSLVRPILDWATGVIVHSRCVESLVLEQAPDRRAYVRFMPMAVPVEGEPPAAGNLRARYGFAEDEFVIASVSTLSYTKRVELALEAVRRLRQKHPKIRFVALGGGTLSNEMRTLIASSGLQETVTHTGWVTAEQYRDYIRLTDAVVDLRYPSGTEASSSLSRAIAFGKPVLVSAHGWFLELLDDFAIKIPVDSSGMEALVRGIADLIERPLRRAAMGKAAWDYAYAHFRLKDCAAAYMAFVEDTIHRTANRRPWSASVPHWPQPTFKRRVLASAYKAFRLPHVARSYGLAGALDKIREELAGKKAAPAGIRQ